MNRRLTTDAAEAANKCFDYNEHYWVARCSRPLDALICCFLRAN